MYFYCNEEKKVVYLYHYSNLCVQRAMKGDIFMGKTLRKSLSVILVVFVLIASLPMQGFIGIEFTKLNFFGIKAEAASIQASGMCGTNVSWELDTDGNLTISGTGKMTSHPWWEDTNSYWMAWFPIYKYTIKSVVIEDGVTSICDFAFRHAKSLKYIQLGNTIKEIGVCAFEECSAVDQAQLIIPESVTKISGAAFGDCSVDSIVILNPLCTIVDRGFWHGAEGDDVSTGVYSNNYRGNIFGYENSTTRDYCTKYGGTFLSLGGGMINSNKDEYSYEIDEYLVLEYGSLNKISNVHVEYDTSSLLVEKDNNYNTVNISSCSLDSSDVPVFSLIPQATHSYISAVHCNGKDALTTDCSIGVSDSSVSQEAFNIQVYPCDYYEIVGYELLQNGSVIQESDTGIFFVDPRTVPVGAPLKVRAIGSDGEKCKPIETNMKTYEAKTQFDSSNNKLSINLPSDIPFVGGAKFAVDFSNLPIFIMKTENTIRIGIGASEKYNSLDGKMVSSSILGSTTTDKKGNTTTTSLWQDWKNVVEKAKEDLAKLNFQNTRSWYKDVYDLKWNNLLSTDSFAPKGNAKVCAYAEFEYIDGEWTAVSSNGILAVDLSMGKEWQTMVWAIPVVIKANGKIGAIADFDVGFNFEDSTWYSNCDVSFTLPELTGSGGPGIAHVADISAFVRLKNKVDVSFTSKYLSCTINGDLGVSGKFLIFSGEKTLWKFVDWQYYYTTWGEQAARSYSLSKDQDVKKEIDKFSMESSYSLDKREHLNNQSEWYGEYNTSTYAINSDNISEKLLQESIFEAANPKVVSTTDGTIMMTWIADIGERAVGNHTALVYSVFNAEANTWSEPAIVYDDGTADASHSIATDGENIYVTWINADKQFDENVTIEDFSSSCEIYASHYNKGTGLFEKHLRITNNENYNYIPEIDVNNGNAYVVYAENTDNAPLALSGTNNIYYSIISKEGIIDTKQIVSTTNPCFQVDISGSDSKVMVAYNCDTDNDLSTNGDVEIFVADDIGNINQITNDTITNENPKFSTIAGSNCLTYFSDNNIYYSADFIEFEKIFDNNVLNDGSDYIFINDGKNDMLFFDKANEETDLNSVFVSVCDEKWNSPVCVTNSDYDIVSFHTYVQDDCIGIVYTNSQRNDNIEDGEDGYNIGTYSEVVNLCSSNFIRYNEIVLDDVYFDDAQVERSAQLPVSVIVSNTGLLPVESLKISVSGGISYSEVLDCNLKCGETEEYVIELPIPYNLNEIKTLKIAVNIPDAEEKDITNNEKSIKIGYADLSISSYFCGSWDQNACMVNIKNESCVQTTAQVNFRKDSYDGEILDTYYVDSIEPFTQKTYYIEPEILKDLYTVNETVFLEVISGTEERNIDNNFTFFVLSKNTELYEYQILEDNTIKLSKYNGTDEHVVVPSEYDGYIVTALGNELFGGSVKTVTISETINDIASKAFNSAINLDSIFVNAKNQNYCSEEGILYSNGYKDVIRCPINSSVSVVELDNTVVSVEDYAFYKTKLSEITLSENLENIGERAFSNCANLFKFSIPEKVTRIGSYAFSNCNSLKTIDYLAVNCQYMGATSAFLYFNCVFYNTYLEAINIGSNVQSIPALAFAYSNAVNINFAEDSSLKTIGNSSFRNCKFKTVDLPDTIKTIGTYAFASCNSLTDIHLKEGLDSLGAGIFSSCSKINAIDIPSTVNHIGEYAFSGCTALVSLSLPDAVTIISNYLCNGCTALNEIDFSGNVTSIGKNAFKGCTNLTSMILPDKLTDIGEAAFLECDSLSELSIPNTVTSIHKNTFKNCDSLKKVVVPYQVNLIEETPFEGCTNVVIWCYNNSVVHEHAVSNSIKYKIIELNADDLVVDGIQDTFIDGLQYQLSAEIAPIYTDEKIAWSSSDSKVFTVSNTGLITAKGAGEAILTVSSSRGSVSKTFNINVLGLIKDSENANLYHVRNADDMVTLSTMVNNGVSFAGKIIQLDNDIDLTNINWTPIGIDSTYVFSGVFDGNNHTITGLNYSTTSNTYSGLFGYIKTGGVKDLTIEGSVNGISRVGMLAGCIFDSALYNCKVIGEVKRIGSGSYGYVGGLVGSALHSVIINCVAETDITVDFGSSSIYYSAVGGIVGAASTSGSDPMCILNSYCIGDINVNGNNYYSTYENYYVGGIAGYLKDDAANNYYFGEITNADEDPIKKIGYAFGYVVPEYTSESDYNGIGTIIVQDNYYLEGKNAIGLISEGDYDSTDWTSAVSTENFSKLIGEGSLVDKLNENKAAVEEIIVAHRDILSNSTWAELVDRINGDSFTVSSWKIGSNNLPVNYECDCYRHAESEWIIDVEATCTKEGSKHTYCLVCQETVTTSIIEKVEHKFSDWTETKAATCTEKGSEYRTCTTCNSVTETRDIAELGHNFVGEWTTDKAPTCTKSGVESRICTRCKSEKETRTVDKLGHDFESKWTVDKEATCSKVGSKSHHCSRCDEKSDVTVVNKIAHTYRESVQEATCTKDGKKTYNCSACGDSYSEVITAKGHIDQNGDGKCDNCDYIYDNTCDHMCHKSGFMGFIWKIVRFFWKLFKMNPVCECGVSHY